jgi:hypothetical protein
VFRIYLRKEKICMFAPRLGARAYILTKYFREYSG